MICEQVNKAVAHYSELDFSSACELILGIAHAGNLYMNDKAPWSLFKQGGSAAEDAAQVSATSLLFNSAMSNYIWDENESCQSPSFGKGLLYAVIFKMHELICLSPFEYVI